MEKVNGTFNFGFSKTLYATFQTIYLKKVISLGDIANETNSPKTSISEQIRSLKKRNLIKDKYQDRQKIFSINLNELKKWTNVDDDIELRTLILISRNFSQLITNCKNTKIKKKKKDEFKGIFEKYYSQANLLDEKLRLEKEVKQLKEKLNQIKKIANDKEVIK